MRFLKMERGIWNFGFGRNTYGWWVGFACWMLVWETDPGEYDWGSDWE